MARILLGNIKGPKGDRGDAGPAGPQGPTGAQGPAGPSMSDAAAFLAAHPVGCIFETTSSASPSAYGGAWTEMPSVGARKWRRDS